MASSGTFTGSRGGGSTGPYLKLAWSTIETDITNNKSKVRLVLSLVSDYSLSFSSSKTGVLDGTSFTYSGGFSGPGTKTIKTLDKWISHSSDGTITTTLNASFAIGVTYSGSTISSLSVSGSATLDAIPMGSDFTSFTLSNTVLNTNTATTINYSLGRKSASYGHDLILKYGSTVIATWSTTGTGALTRALSSAEVNAIILKMATVTSGKLTLTMQTTSGSKDIGSSKSISEDVTLNTSIVPVASGLSVSIFGSGIDKTLAKYIQGMSRVTASFAGTAGYGASVSSNTITIKRKSDGGNVQTITGNVGTTPNPVILDGVYDVIAKVTDSRGRSASVSTTISVEVYGPPIISLFTVNRTSPTTTISVAFKVAWNLLGGGNTASIVLTRTDAAGAVTTLYTLSNSAAGTVNTTQTYTGQSDAGTFLYTLKVTDKSGNISASEVQVGTSFMEFTISKGKGVGIGKVHQKGALDVAGDIHLSGDVNVTGNLNLTSGSRIVMPPNQYAGTLAGLDMKNSDIVGINNLYMSDLTNSDSEGLQFKKSTTPEGDFTPSKWDTFRVANGTALLNGIPIGTSDSEILYSGGVFLQASQTIVPTKPMSACQNGWILVWSRYDGGNVNSFWNFTHVPKYFAIATNGGIAITLSGDPNSGGGTVSNMGAIYKYVYATDTSIIGHDQNNTTLGKRAVLRYVLSY